MGRRGKNAEPGELRLLKGKALVDPNQPQPAKTRGARAPFKLSGLARRRWREITKILEDTNVLTEADLGPLARYCIYWAEFVELVGRTQGKQAWTEKISNKGHAYQVKCADVSRMETLEPLLLRIEKEFGLTPAARGGLEVKVPRDKKSKFKQKLYG